MQGENAWVFVGEDVIADSVKAYHKFNEKLLDKYPKDKRKDMKPTAISGQQAYVSCVRNVLLSCNDAEQCR